MYAYNPHAAGRPGGYAAFPNLQDYYRLPNQGYATGPKLLDNIVPQAPQVPRRPQFGMGGQQGYKSPMSGGVGAPQIAGPPAGYEQYLLDPWSGRIPGLNYNMPHDFSKWKRIFFQGRTYMLPPGVQPPEGYVEPNFQLKLY